MYVASLKPVDAREARMIVRVCADTLAEAERYVIRYLQDLFDSRSVVLVYNDDLIYHVYDHRRFLGIVEIRVEG